MTPKSDEYIIIGKSNDGSRECKDKHGKCIDIYRKRKIITRKEHNEIYILSKMFNMPKG